MWTDSTTFEKTSGELICLKLIRVKWKVMNRNKILQVNIYTREIH